MRGELGIDVLPVDGLHCNIQLAHLGLVHLQVCTQRCEEMGSIAMHLQLCLIKRQTSNQGGYEQGQHWKPVAGGQG